MKTKETTASLHIPSRIVNPPKLPQSAIANLPQNYNETRSTQKKCVQGNVRVMDLDLKSRLLLIWVLDLGSVLLDLGCGEV